MSMGGWGVPGVGAERSVAESELLWGADQARNSCLWQSVLVSGTARDAANSPTTVLRPGLIMGRITSSGKLIEWVSTATDGSQEPVAILDAELRAQDFDATNQDRVFRAIVARAPLKARSLKIQGAAFVGHADEYLARRKLYAAHHILDDDPFGYLAGQGNRVLRVTTATDTVTAAQNGALKIYSNAAAVTITLPAIQPGLIYDFLREADEEMVVVSPTADNVIVGNDLSADGVTFTTASEQIGTQVRVESIYVNTTLKWRMTLPYVPFGTGVNTPTFSIQT